MICNNCGEVICEVQWYYSTNGGTTCRRCYFENEAKLNIKYIVDMGICNDLFRFDEKTITGKYSDKKIETRFEILDL